jgi:aerobic carbon-monoxide dehydrogenase medium subunit
VIPAAFELRRPRSLQEAIGFLGEDAKLLAGGQSLIPLMKLRLAAPSVLVDLGGVDGLSYVREDGDRVAIGALAEVGDPQVRNRGTIGGSLAHADPHGDLPAVVVALGGEIVAVGPDGERTIPARSFFQGYLTTALVENEVLTEVRVPRPERSAYVKFNRRAQDWALVGCAAVVEDGRQTIAWTGVAAAPVLAEADFEQAAAKLDPAGDLSGSPEYKRHLAAVLARRAIEQASSG